MKKKMILVIGLVFLLASCAAAAVGDTNVGQFGLKIDQGGAAGFQGQGPDGNIHQDTLDSLFDTDLTEAEIEGILFMYEEEKLARDVYLALAERWGMNIFSNIAVSENTHINSVLTLIEISNLEDPVGDSPQGAFVNQELQTLYNDLEDRGNLSLEAALLVGGAIEEIDILDLKTYLAETDNSAVTAVYQNLLMGSVNHLQAFVRSFERQTGESYQLQFLSQEAYDELMASSMERGVGGGRGMNAGSQGRGQLPG